MKRALEFSGIAIWICVFSLILLEGVLHLYNPFHSSVRGNQIVLNANTSWTYSGGGSQLDSTIIHRKNNIGFRGDDYEPDADALRIFTVGGSTTEEIFLTEGKTWSDNLHRLLTANFRDLWLNNAGFTGHSTFGHQILLEDHIVRYKPNVVLFLVGINDVHRAELNRAGDGKHVSQAATHSEVIALGLNLYRSLQARRRGIGYNTEGLQQSWLVSWEIREEEKRFAIDNAESLLDGYRARLTELIKTSRAMGAEPVIMTQPVLYGAGIDDRKGLDLSQIYVAPVDGATAWKVLEMYNQAARETAFENEVLLVDLSVQLRKTSLYFFDTIHFTNEGAAAIADIVYRNICPFLIDRFPKHAVRPCPEFSSPQE